MKEVDAWKRFWFLAGLAVLAVGVHEGVTRYNNTRYREEESADLLALRDAASRTAPVFTPAPAPSSTAAAPPARQVSMPAPSRLWPQETTPTRTIYVPDPAKRETGVIEEFFGSSDDWALEIERGWLVEFASYPDKLEFRVDLGDGYKSVRQIRQEKGLSASQEIPWWRWKKTVRVRLEPGATAGGALRILLQRHALQNQPPAVPPQEFKDFRVTLNRLQSSANARALIDLDFLNTNPSHSIAIGIHSPRQWAMSEDEVRINGGLTSSDGIELECKELQGLLAVSANPDRLTEIAPGETRHVSFRYQSAWGSPGRPRSFRLRLPIVVCSPYDRSRYANYKREEGVLPPGCKIENMIMDIGVSYSDE